MDLVSWPKGLLFLVFTLFAGARPATAGALYAPQLCTPKEMKLLVRNPSREARMFWVQTRRGREVSEASFSVDPGATLTVSGPELAPLGTSFSIRDGDNDLIYFLDCRSLVRMSPVASPRVEFELGATVGTLALRLQNLHHSPQNVEVSFIGGDGRTLHDLNLALDKNYVSTETRLRPPPGTARILVEGSGRLSVFLLTEKGRPLVADVREPAKLKADPNTAYFLAADQTGTQSYVVPLRDPELIAQARAIVANKLPRIVLAEIGPADATSSNRDLLAADAAPWSWQVFGVTGFAELAHQDCSGSPGMIEDFKEAWMPETRGICFWHYHLKRELTPAEVSTGRTADAVPDPLRE